MKLQKNKKLAIAISIIFSITLFISSLTFAQGYGMGGGGFGRNQQGNGPGYGMRGSGYGWSQQALQNRLAFRTDMYNARVQLLSTMANESQETIKAKLRYKPMWAVLDEYKIDYAEFNKKLTAKRAEVIKKAVADNRITQQQADYMLQRNTDGLRPGLSGRGFGAGRRGHRGGWGFRGDCPRF